MGSVKVWNGSTWVDVQSVKTWSGSAWVNRIVKHWNGSSWVDDSTKVITLTSNMTGSVSKAWEPTGWRGSNDRPYQSAWDDSKNNVGFIWFDSSEFAQLSGKTIVSTEAYLYRQSGAGYSAARGVHIWGTSLQASARSSSKTLAQAVATLYNETADAISLAWSAGGWGTISNAIAEGMRDGTRFGIAVYVASGAMNEYAIFDAYNETHPPQIRITCY
ncbi:MAG: hypothetical protein EOM68_25990 [Spirochaetia bacterium]|nr:hypothetical protein [Spirochaetia bacterium]